MILDPKHPEVNPFKYAGHWFWRDENTHPHGPFASQVDALYGLLAHIAPPWYIRLWRNVKLFWGDTNGSSVR